MAATFSDVFVISCQRTPIGAFQGSLSSVPAPQLGAQSIRAALEKASIPPEKVNQCLMGEVLTGGVGQAPARQAALAAGLAQSTPCMTINKVCGSGLKAVMLGSDAIQLGDSEIVVAGGQESMSLAPHLLQKSRSGYRLGPVQVQDSMLLDGLWDPYNDWHLGNSAELCVREYKSTQEEQDEFAKESYKRAQTAQNEGFFKDEIIPVEITSKKKTTTVETDDEPAKANFEKMAQLKPAFEKNGTITAANASKINDGGAAVTLASGHQVKELGLKPMGRIVAHATFAQDPKWFTTAPIDAVKKVLQKAQLKADAIDLWEINEAFSIVTMAAIKELGISHDQVNVNGGAVALGHPIGASGARIFTTLLHAMKQRQKRYGLATLCIGGGEAVAVIVENV